MSSTTTPILAVYSCQVFSLSLYKQSIHCQDWQASHFPRAQRERLQKSGDGVTVQQQIDSVLMEALR